MGVGASMPQGGFSVLLSHLEVGEFVMVSDVCLRQWHQLSVAKVLALSRFRGSKMRDRPGSRSRSALKSTSCSLPRPP